MSFVSDIPSPLSLLDNTNCQWQDVEVEGQTFSSVEEFRQGWNQNTDTDFSQVKDRFQFRVTDGILQYKTCVESAGGIQ